MAGWTCPDLNLIEWDGDIRAKFYEGDGSKLINLPAGAESDPIWLAASSAVWTDININTASNAIVRSDFDTHAASSSLHSGIETDPTFQAASSAYNEHLVASLAQHIDWTNATDNFDTSGTLNADGNITTGGTVDGIDIAGQAVFVTAAYNHITASGASHTDVAANTASCAMNTASNALIRSDYNTHEASTAIHFTSNALWTDVNANTAKTSYTDATQYQVTSAAAIVNTASNASIRSDYDTHVADSSDPHGSTLTQTYISMSSAACTGDITTSGAPYVPNVVFGTGATAPAATLYPMGTIYVQYTP